MPLARNKLCALAYLRRLNIGGRGAFAPGASGAGGRGVTFQRRLVHRPNSCVEVMVVEADNEGSCIGLGLLISLEDPILDDI